MNLAYKISERMHKQDRLQDDFYYSLTPRGSSRPGSYISLSVLEEEEQSIEDLFGIQTLYPWQQALLEQERNRYNSLREMRTAEGVRNHATRQGVMRQGRQLGKTDMIRGIRANYMWLTEIGGEFI